MVFPTKEEEIDIKIRERVESFLEREGERYPRHIPFLVYLESPNKTPEELRGILIKAITEYRENHEEVKIDIRVPME